MLGDDLQTELRDRTVEHLLRDAGLDQPHRLLLRLHPVRAQLQDARDDARLLATSARDGRKCCIHPGEQMKMERGREEKGK